MPLRVSGFIGERREEAHAIVVAEEQPETSHQKA